MCDDVDEAWDAARVAVDKAPVRAAGEQFVAGVPPATRRRWRTYSPVSLRSSGSRCQRTVMRWFSCARSGRRKIVRSSGWPTSTIWRELLGLGL